MFAKWRLDAFTAAHVDSFNSFRLRLAVEPPTAVADTWASMAVEHQEDVAAYAVWVMAHPVVESVFDAAEVLKLAVSASPRHVRRRVLKQLKSIRRTTLLLGVVDACLSVSLHYRKLRLRRDGTPPAAGFRAIRQPGSGAFDRLPVRWLTGRPPLTWAGKPLC